MTQAITRFGTRRSGLFILPTSLPADACKVSYNLSLMFHNGILECRADFGAFIILAAESGHNRLVKSIIAILDRLHGSFVFWTL